MSKSESELEIALKEETDSIDGMFYLLRKMSTRSAINFISFIKDATIDCMTIKGFGEEN